uniref:Thyrotropin subunit beta n=1 Tax=Paramormyrops kingsleyae TaxID=1676925 RepID=A0A3B3RLN4_9TELE
MMGSIAVIVCGLLCVLCGQALALCVLTDYTLYVEKPGCDYCMAVNTTICMGLCYSWDTNMVGPVGKRHLTQRGCTYRSVEYRTAVLPGCRPHVNPHFTYPAALGCHCSNCNTDSHECAHKGGSDDRAQCTKPLTHTLSSLISLHLNNTGQ